MHEDRHLLEQIFEQGELIMATLEDLKTKTDTLTQALADLVTRSSAPSLDQPTLDAIGGALDTAITTVGSIDQPAAPVISPPVAEAPVEAAAPVADTPIVLPSA